MRVPKGGSSCARCSFYRRDGGDHGRCTHQDYQAYYGTDLIPYPADEFCSDWYEIDRARADAADTAANIARTVSHVRMHRAVGSARRRTGRTPRPMYPKAVEVAYGGQLAKLGTAVRDGFKPLLDALPGLLARAHAARGDGAGEGTAAGVFLQRELESVNTWPRDPKERAPVALRSFAGLPVVVENPRGSVRHWVDHDGTAGATTMQWDYGYVHGMPGDDGEDVDVYLGPDESAPNVYAVAQRRKSSGYRVHDEHKVMLGFASRDAAIAAYLAHRDDPRAMGNVVEMDAAEFRRRLQSRGKIPSPFRYDASDADRARDLVDRARAYVERVMSPAYVEALAKKMGVRVSDANLEELRRQTRSALGVAMTTPDRALPALLDHFAKENAALIKSLSRETTDKIEKMIMRAVTSGQRHEQLAADIRARFDVTERHARFIARDQVGKLYGQLARSRHRELGVSRYIQRTVGDGKVRPLHRQYERESLASPFSYDDPPEDGIPGEAYGCRCAGQPVFDEIIHAIRVADGE